MTSTSSAHNKSFNQTQKAALFPLVNSALGGSSFLLSGGVSQSFCACFVAHRFASVGAALGLRGGQSAQASLSQPTRAFRFWRMRIAWWLVAFPCVQRARFVAAVRSSQAGSALGAGHNGYRTCGTTATAVSFGRAARLRGCRLTFRSSGRRSTAFVLANLAAGAAYLKR